MYVNPLISGAAQGGGAQIMGATGGSSFFGFGGINNARTLGATPLMGVTTLAAGLTSTLSSMYSLRQSSKAAKANASSLYRESMLYSRQGDFMLKSANLYSGIAKKMVAMGNANARNERIRAGKVQFFIDASQGEAVKESEQVVGEGLASFAANGVLIEGRDGAAVAMWEQDEAADNAYQQLLIMQKGQDTIWEYMMAANQREAEGWGQAAGAYGQAAEAAGSAYSAYLSSYESHKQADAMARAARKARRGMLGSGIGSALGAVAAVGAAAFTGGASLAAYATLAGAGMSVGSSVGATSPSW